VEGTDINQSNDSPELPEEKSYSNQNQEEAENSVSNEYGFPPADDDDDDESSKDDSNDDDEDDVGSVNRVEEEDCDRELHNQNHQKMLPMLSPTIKKA
jgi:hypothetical protein